MVIFWVRIIGVWMNLYGRWLVMCWGVFMLSCIDCYWCVCGWLEFCWCVFGSCLW